MSKKREKSLVLFRQGVQALKSINADIPAVYACPLCLRGFPEESIYFLTQEHVPPKSLKGHRLVLTCLDCNGRAGGQDGVDTHARRGEDQLEFLSRTLDGTRRVRFSVGEASMNADIQYIDGHLEIVGAPGPPGSGEEVMALFEKMFSDQSFREILKIAFNRDRFRQSFQETAWLRAGYLAAFAALGYRYILGDSLKLVRSQIESPDSAAIDDFHMWVPPKSSNAPPSIVLVREPEWVKGIAVRMGFHLILLPLMGDDLDFYARMRRFEGTTLQNISGPELPWPIRPRFELDLHPHGEVFRTIRGLYASKVDAG